MGLNPRPGSKINSIGKAIQYTAESNGYKVIRNLAAHGVGKTLHEEPDGIVSYFNPRDSRKLKLGQVIAIEPFISTISIFAHELEDGWTLAGHPQNFSAQFEHTIIITNGSPIIASL